MFSIADLNSANIFLKKHQPLIPSVSLKRPSQCSVRQSNFLGFKERIGGKQAPQHRRQVLPVVNQIHMHSFLFNAE